MSHVTEWFLHLHGIHVTRASPTNHPFLITEHGIKSLGNKLMKYLSGFNDNWPLYCKPVMLVCNPYVTPKP